MNGRAQYVNVNGVDSKLSPIRCGVPQGSILGPLLFIMYVNDLVNSSELANFIMFADDTNLFFSHKDCHCLEKVINDELSKISNWFKLNKLSLNIKKTNYIVFTSGRFKTDPSTKFQIKIENIVIEQVWHTKFLGIVINSRLTWEDHINILNNKISKSLGIILKARRNLNSDTLFKLYHTLVQPYLDYCNIVWASIPSGALLKLCRNHKKALRIITFSKRNCHSKPLFRRLEILPVTDLNKYQVLCIVYKALNGLQPAHFQSLFELNIDIHKHFTRQTSKIHVRPCRTKIRQYSIKIYGTKLWNLLDTNTTNSSFNVFRKNAKPYCLITYEPKH